MSIKLLSLSLSLSHTHTHSEVSLNFSLSLSLSLSEVSLSHSESWVALMKSQLRISDKVGREVINDSARPSANEVHPPYIYIHIYTHTHTHTHTHARTYTHTHKHTHTHTRTHIHTHQKQCGLASERPAHYDPNLLSTLCHDPSTCSLLQTAKIAPKQTVPPDTQSQM